MDRQPEPPVVLPRVLGPFDACMVVVGSVIGTGIFLKPATVATAMPYFGPIVSVWIVVGFVTLCGCLALAELGAMLPQAGGAFPWLIGRFDRGVEVRKELEHMKQPASAYLKRFYYDTVSHHPRIMKFLTELVGVDRVVLGSDYNQDMSEERPVQFVESVPGLTAQERQLILEGNAKRLLRL